jgi:hypothetical protein
MSRRGGGSGGRGRGGGSNKSTLSASKELLKRSASEAGLDDRHIKVLSDITRPPLFPDFLWKSTGHYWSEEEYNPTNNNDTNNIKIEQEEQVKPTLKATTKLPTSMISLINKQREMTQRFQSSSYYVRPNTVVDVVRYRDRKNLQNNNNNNHTPDAKVLSSFSPYNNRNHNILAADAMYFPEELLLLNSNNSSKKKSNPNLKGHSQQSQQQKRIPSNLSLQNKDTTDINSFKSNSSVEQTNSFAVKLEELDNQEMAIISSSPTTGLTKLRTTSITSLSIGNDDYNVKARENDEKGNINNNNNNEDDDVDDEDITIPIEEEELVEDYTTNYYASDDEDDGDDGEPTY